MDASPEHALYWPYWGKTSSTDDSPLVTYHLLVFHCLDVAAVADALLEADGLLAGRMAALSPFPWEETLPWLQFFAAVHDLGKFAPPFQYKVQGLAERLGVPAWPYACARRHTELGAAAWRAYARGIRVHGLVFGQDERDVLSPLAEAAFGHHGEPLAGTARGHESLRPVASAITAYLADCADFFLSAAAPVSDQEQVAFRPLSWLFAGLLVLADWIASNEDWFPHLDTWTGLAPAWAVSQQRARAAVQKVGVLLPPPASAVDFHALLPHLPPDAVPRPLQRFAQEYVPAKGPQLLILEDLTGSGKTEAAILAAHGLMLHGGAGGLYAGLPTMATANAMYARLAATYRALFVPDARPSLMLAHGARTIHDDFLASVAFERILGGLPPDANEPESGAACAPWLADNRKKALLAPCGAGTLDQALLAVLPSRHQALRLLGLARSVLVADEVHAYDAYTGRLLERLLTFHAALGGSAVLLTATLPRALRERLVAAHLHGRALWGGEGMPGPAVPEPPLRHELHGMDFPLATVAADGRVEEIEIAAAKSLRVDVDVVHDEAAMFERILAVRAAGGCAAFVRNTVDGAIEARRRLIEEFGLPPGDVLLFHARFTGQDRLAIESRVLGLFGKDADPAARRGKVLVATQVVEQSLDLDFDLVLSDLAPLELLIQRAGRCQRHGGRFPRPEGFPAPRLVVLAPEPTDDVDATWLDTLLPHTALIYPVHGVLWRTARLCLAHGCFDLPARARELIEGAYDGGDVPEALAEEDDRLEGELWALRSMASRNALEFSMGYARESSDILWDADVRTPTRLGQETVQARLLCLADGELRLWAAESQADCSMRACLRSEVRVPAYRLKEPSLSAPVQALLADALERMPDKGGYAVPVVLEPALDLGPGVWLGRVLDGKGREGRLIYDAELGLRWTEWGRF